MIRVGHHVKCVDIDGFSGAEKDHLRGRLLVVGRRERYYGSRTAILVNGWFAQHDWWLLEERFRRSLNYTNEEEL